MNKKIYKWSLSKQAVHIFILAMVMTVTTIFSVQIADAAPMIERHEGARRENVAENVAKKHFSDSDKVIIVNQNKFPDAISASNISQGKYPVLYTHERYVSNSTLSLIQSMALNEIYILGGESSINPSVVDQLRNATGVEVTRIDGSNRYVANVNAVSLNFNQKNHVVIASGQVYADALYGVSYANTIDAPIVLTKKNNMAPETIQLLKDLNVTQATIVGGPATVTADVENQLTHLGILHNRIAGKNRYTGSAKVASASYSNPENVVVASGEVFPDALVSAPLAQKLDAPILLVQSNRIHSDVESYIVDHLPTIKSIYIQGGHRTIQPSLLDSIVNQSFKELTDILEIPFNQRLFNEEILALVNEERTRLKIEPLSYESALQSGVNLRTLESISIQTLDHARPNKSSWATAFDYLNNTQVQAASENLAYNWITYKEYEELSQTVGALEAHLAQVFYKQYADSPGHYRNMVNAGYDGMAVSTMFANHNNSEYFIQVYNTMISSIRY